MNSDTFPLGLYLSDVEDSTINDGEIYTVIFVYTKTYKIKDENGFDIYQEE